MNAFHGEFSSSDASGLSEPNSRFSLYGARGGSALSLDSNDAVTITDLHITSAGTNLTITVYDGSDNSPGAGELVFKGVIPTNSTVIVPLQSPQECAKGSYPKCKASGAGQVDITIHGTILRLTA